MIETPEWFLVFSVVKDVLIVGIAGAGLFAILFAKKQLDLIKNQTKETRDQFRIRNQRESISLAIELSEKFPDLIKRKDRLVKDNNSIFQKYYGLTGKYIENILTVKNCCETIPQETMIKILTSVNPIFPELLQISNELEAISLYFVNCVADEESVYPSLAPVFCHIFETVYPVLIHQRCLGCGTCNSAKTKQRHELFSNSFNLYKIWKSRLLKTKMEHDIDSFVDKHKELDSKSKPLKVLGNE